MESCYAHIYEDDHYQDEMTKAHLELEEQLEEMEIKEVKQLPKKA